MGAFFEDLSLRLKRAHCTRKYLGIYGIEDCMTVHEADHGKPGRRPRASKDGATFDTELQRYVMPANVSLCPNTKVSVTQRGAGSFGSETKRR
jgi:hypothetical protein